MTKTSSLTPPCHPNLIFIKLPYLLKNIVTCYSSLVFVLYFNCIFFDDKDKFFPSIILSINTFTYPANASLHSGNVPFHYHSLSNMILTFSNIKNDKQKYFPYKNAPNMFRFLEVHMFFNHFKFFVIQCLYKTV